MNTLPQDMIYEIMNFVDPQTKWCMAISSSEMYRLAKKNVAINKEIFIFADNYRDEKYVIACKRNNTWHICGHDGSVQEAVKNIIVRYDRALCKKFGVYDTAVIREAHTRFYKYHRGSYISETLISEDSISREYYPSLPECILYDSEHKLLAIQRGKKISIIQGVVYCKVRSMTVTYDLPNKHRMKYTIRNRPQAKIMIDNYNLNDEITYHLSLGIHIVGMYRDEMRVVIPMTSHEYSVP